MNTQIKFVPHVIKTGGDITMFLNGVSEAVSTDHPNYSKIVDALKSGNYDVLPGLVNISKAVTSYTAGGVEVRSGELFFNGAPVHNTLTNRIIAMMKEGYKFDHMLKFLSNLMANPSFRAVNETYTFLENAGLQITEDGCFLAYKAVRNNYTDIHSGKFSNKVGDTPSMPRNQVDENYERDCSNGLHVGALNYVIDFGHFQKGAPVSEGGNRLLIVKVNPRDVVSVPHYAGHTKMRVSTYTVVDEIKDVVKELDKAVYTADAKPLAPDLDVVEDLTTETEYNINDDYDAGFDDGEADEQSNEAYGFSRQASVPGSNYSRGYNDGYNERDYNPTVETSDIDLEDADFEAGEAAGERDFNIGNNYGTNLAEDASDAFKDGYRSGFNG